MRPITTDIKAPCFSEEQIQRITEINFLPKQDIKPCDSMFVFGCADPKIWDIVYDAYMKKLMKTIIISGGYNPNPKAPQKDWTYGEVSEARVIADKLIELGVPKDIIIVEDRARNSIENVLFSMKIFNFNNINSLLYVAKETAAGRQFRTLKKHLPNYIEIIPYTYETILYGDIISRDNWMNTEKGRSFVWQGYLRNILYGMNDAIFPVDEPIEELQKHVLEYWD